MPEPTSTTEVVTLEELLAGVTSREPMDGGLGKSGADLERVRIDGVDHVVKYLDMTRDWTMRAAGVEGGASLLLWQRGLLQALPECFDQPIIGVARGPRYPGGPDVTALLMRDVAGALLPATDEPIPLELHLQFLDHMAALHNRFWEAGPMIDIVSPTRRYLELSPSMSQTEAALGADNLVPRLVGQGWPLLEQVAPIAAAVVVPLAHDPTALITALGTTPQTLLHGNFKLDNLGVTDQRRTVVFDWETSGRGAATSDLAWYLAINCRRLPQSKEASITAFRTSLEAYGVDTESWWERQLALSLLGGLVHFGWEKAFGGLDDELLWWQERAVEAAPLLRA
ncbi:MAG TPA: phosphotransferase [Candidatus Nanopelagicales bacterium]|jgi:hypothetical protein